MGIAENVRKATRQIGEAASRAGRRPDDITLVAVTKTRTVEEIEEAADCGIIHLGENRVQEAADKIPVVKGDVTWHMVGPLQSNKGKRAAGLFDWVDSIHSGKIIDILSAHAEITGRKLSVLIQVNISDENVKSGVPPGQAGELAACALGKEGIEVRGLMTIGSFGVSSAVTRSEFARMRELFDTLRGDPVVGKSMDVLSMGMSHDFDIAIEEGATMVRIGTAIFGMRNR